MITLGIIAYTILGSHINEDSTNKYQPPLSQSTESFLLNLRVPESKGQNRSEIGAIPEYVEKISTKQETHAITSKSPALSGYESIPLPISDSDSGSVIITTQTKDTSAEIDSNGLFESKPLRNVTYTETLKLSQNCPSYLPTYLDHCYGISDTFNDIDEPDFDIQEILLSDIQWNNLSLDDFNNRIDKVCLCMSLEFKGTKNVFDMITNLQDYWCKLITSKNTASSIRVGLYRMVADFVKFVDDGDDHLDYSLYLKFVEAMLSGLYYQDQHATWKQYGCCIRNFLTILTSISPKDFFEVVFEKWYDSEKERPFSKQDLIVGEIKVELLKLILASSYVLITGDQNTFDNVFARLDSANLLQKHQEDGRIRLKIQELIIIQNTLISAFKKGDNENHRELGVDSSSFKRKLSSSTKSSTVGQHKRLKALADITNHIDK